MLPNADNSQPGGDSVWPPKMFKPQPGDVSRLYNYAQAMIEAHQRLELAHQSARRAANTLDLSKDDFMEEYRSSDLEGEERLVFKSLEGEVWIVAIDAFDGSVLSVTPAVEVE